MRNWKTWVVVAGGCVALALLAPVGVERLADRMARSRAESLAVDVEWREVEWFWTDSVHFTDVRIQHGPIENAKVGQLDVTLEILTLASGELEVGGISALGVDADVQLSSNRTDDSTTPDADGGSPSPFETYAETLHRFRLSDAVVDLRRSDRNLATWRGSAELSASGELSGDGNLELGVGREASAINWSLAGEADPAEPRARGEVFLGPPGEAGAEPGDRGEVRAAPIRAAADALEFRLGTATESGLASLAVRDFSASVGDETPPGLEISGPKLQARLLAGRRLHLIGTSPRIKLAPERLLAILRTRTASPPGASARKTGGKTGGAGGLRAFLLEKVDLSLEETTFELSIEGRDGWRSYRFTEQLTFWKRGRRLAASGAFAGGWAAGRANFEPGHRLPAGASFRVRDVQLDEVPVVRTERSLPNKGVRGEVGGTVDASGSLVRTGLRGTLHEQITGSVELDWRDGLIRADGLADRPLRDIDLSLALSVEWEPEIGRIRLRDSQLRFGPVEIGLRGALVDRKLDPHLSFDARASEIDCQRAVRALPATLLGPYRDVAIEGRTTPHFSLDLPLDNPGELSLELDGFPGSCRPTALNARKPGWPDVQFVRGSRANASVPTATNTSVRQWAAAPDPDHSIAPPPSLEPIPSSWDPNRPRDIFWLRNPFVMPVTEGVSEGADVRIGPGLSSYVPLQSLPKHVAGAAYLSEEINFYNDGAWNLRLIEKGLQLNLDEERFVYGGSTVTQQLVKNLFLTRRKTLDRKIQEALIAWRMQGVVSKDRVLELYLNCIEFGEDIYGIGPAARHYFQKHARELTPLEGVFLAVIKPAPWFGDEFRDEGSTPTSGWWRDRMNEIMERLVQKGFITEQRAEDAKPYVLKWDDSGNYLPDAPETSEDEKTDGEEDESEGLGSSE